MNTERDTGMKIQHSDDLRDRGCKEKHDNICRIVADEYERRGFRTEVEQEYHDDHFQGDIDVAACKPGYLIINEIKSTDGERQYLKGLQQLAKAYTHAEIYKPQDKIFTAYAAADPKTDDVYLNWVPRKDVPNKYERQLPEDLRRHI